MSAANFDAAAAVYAGGDDALWAHLAEMAKRLGIPLTEEELRELINKGLELPRFVNSRCLAIVRAHKEGPIEKMSDDDFRKVMQRIASETPRVRHVEPLSQRAPMIDTRRKAPVAVPPRASAPRENVAMITFAPTQPVSDVAVVPAEAAQEPVVTHDAESARLQKIPPYLRGDHASSVRSHQGVQEELPIRVRDVPQKEVAYPGLDQERRELAAQIEQLRQERDALQVERDAMMQSILILQEDRQRTRDEVREEHKTILASAHETARQVVAAAETEAAAAKGALLDAAQHEADDLLRQARAAVSQGSIDGLAIRASAEEEAREIISRAEHAVVLMSAMMLSERIDRPTSNGSAHNGTPVHNPIPTESHSANGGNGGAHISRKKPSPSAKSSENGTCNGTASCSSRWMAAAAGKAPNEPIRVRGMT